MPPPHRGKERSYEELEAEYYGWLRFLVTKATWLDKWRARRISGYWLNAAKRELLIAGETEGACERVLRKFGR